MMECSAAIISRAIAGQDMLMKVAKLLTNSVAGFGCAATTADQNGVNISSL
ncbi:hypothetical protein [Escherichia coli]|uniref:hypothetical protein n=1 Tax=Escherichia coli TaxID=562 RepID=UPI00157B72DC|nr:hypothetical protein [Escherichia coli]